MQEVGSLQAKRLAAHVAVEGCRKWVPPGLPKGGSGDGASARAVLKWAKKGLVRSCFYLMGISWSRMQRWRSWYMWSSAQGIARSCPMPARVVIYSCGVAAS